MDPMVLTSLFDLVAKNASRLKSSPLSWSQGKRLGIYSDSEAALKIIVQSTVSLALTQEWRNSLEELARTKAVKLKYVPRHKGVEGNERPDELARQSISRKIWHGNTFDMIPSARGSASRMSRSRQDIRWLSGI